MLDGQLMEKSERTLTHNVKEYYRKIKRSLNLQLEMEFRLGELQDGKKLRKR